MRKFLITLVVEKDFWVSPKNPDTYKSQGQLTWTHTNEAFTLAHKSNQKANITSGNPVFAFELEGKELMSLIYKELSEPKK